jgi:hypothetical protein
MRSSGKAVEQHGKRPARQTVERVQQKFAGASGCVIVARAVAERGGVRRERQSRQQESLIFGEFDPAGVRDHAFAVPVAARGQDQRGDGTGVRRHGQLRSRHAGAGSSAWRTTGGAAAEGRQSKRAVQMSFIRHSITGARAMDNRSRVVIGRGALRHDSLTKKSAFICAHRRFPLCYALCVVVGAAA